MARAAASNFYYAFYMLPRAKRDALCALYAFMRLVDDVSDTPAASAADADDEHRREARGAGALARAAGSSRRRRCLRRIRSCRRLPTPFGATAFRRAISTI